MNRPSTFRSLRHQQLGLETLEHRQMLTGMPEFVVDVDPLAASTLFHDFVTVGQTAYFTADSAATGREVWKTDGTAAGTAFVKDVWVGASGGFQSEIVPLNNRIAFQASPGYGNFPPLWASDGTEQGTQPFFSPTEFSKHSRAESLVSVGSGLLFRTFGDQLWFSDGTAEGTRVLTSNGVATDSGRVRAVAVGSTFFFVAQNEQGYELWKTDGTPESTQMVCDIATGGASSTPNHLVNVNGTLFFVANDGVTGPALWKSDGTAEGTVLVKDINPGGIEGTVEGLTAFGDKLLIQANDGFHGTELWISDGTSEGTQLLADLTAGTASTSFQQFAVAGEFAFFVANDGVHGEQLWRTDGTTTGTIRLTDVVATSSHTGPYRLTSVGEKVFFATPQEEIWQSNGQVAEAVVDGAGKTLAAGFSPWGVASGALLFQGEQGLWKTDGTAAGTQLVSRFRGAGSFPEHLTDVNGTLFFMARDADSDIELWKSDGTAVGTQRVVDLDVVADGPFLPTQLLNHQGTLLFRAPSADGSGYALWRSDGTSEGTTKLVAFPKNRAVWEIDEISIGSQAFFSFVSLTGVNELWATDGTTEGTHLVKEFPLPADQFGASIDNFTQLNGKFFFTSHNPTIGTALWTSDGTPGGTVQVAALTAGRVSAASFEMEAFNGSLYINSGSQFWKSDGTAQGTQLVDDLGNGGRRQNLTAVGPYLYYWQVEINSPSRLWRTDGTPEGTVPLIESIPPYAFTNTVRVAFDNTFYFTNWDAVHGEELWRSDGTPEGTYLVQDIAKPGGSRPWDFAVSKNMLYFTAADNVNGRTIWRLGLSADPVVETAGSTSYVENAAPVLIAADATIADADSAAFKTGKLTVQFTTGAEAADRLAIRSAGDLVVSGQELKFKGILIGTFTGGVGTEPLVVTFNEKASPFRAQMVLRSVTYRSLSESPSATPRQLMITLTDGDGGMSSPVSKSITVTPINDAPKLNTALSPTLTAINENNHNAWGTPVWTLLPGYSDVDAGALKGLAITSASGATQGAWQYTLDGGATWLDLGAVSLSAAKLLPAQGNLSRVRFVPNANYHGTVQLGYFAWDQTQGVSGGTFDLSGSGKFGGTTAFGWGYETASLTVNPVNTPPRLTLPSAPVGYALNSPAVLLASTATVKDPDTVRFTGGWLKVEIINGADGQDRLSIGGPFKVVEGNLIWNNTATIGTVQGGVGSSALMVNLNANATLYRVEQLVRSIKFGTLGSSKTGQRTVAFSVSDGMSNSNVATLDVQIG
jgi:ELWxxDGT repeat protein